MTKIEKLLQRLYSLPKDFTYSELKKIMKSLGFIEHTKGKTSGSRVAFHNQQHNLIIRLHKPHPGNILKRYQLVEVIKIIKKLGDNDE
ncbi:type II toxin-antitoxin system HicA family toxin [Desulfuribacillus alkaliarsenatis]|uniref:Hexulose-6-phosphate isomerase n=1 Tax=Desulfuribacillus alkaliarsenatis TaxID=766136 RepID=A0A1E5FZS6_9FIRM|nr:type II toxin-antitoxin system HicA family toxin [Desulfuribacillus alkaliarsenatis]OEF95948.1 hypothetical protein BHF68_11195 [Desulfuribacillus alkaliarsenatis]